MMSEESVREKKETRRIRIKKSNGESQERHRSLARDGVTYAVIRPDVQRDGCGPDLIGLGRTQFIEMELMCIDGQSQEGVRGF